MSQSKHYITPPKLCTGCALCANVCPKDTIRMRHDKDGFLVPHVDTSACINCGLCVKVCPAQPKTLPKVENTQPFDSITAYGAWHLDKTMQTASSSGGLFSALAEHIFAEKGCVFGVVWQNKTTACYRKAENMQEIAPMRCSKYVQAIPGYVYRDVKAELEKGRQVLFVGTSCQVYALQKYLRKPYSGLLTVDIICHGVPSWNLLSSYIDYVEKKQGHILRNINFRYKDGNWIGYKVQNIFSNGETISEPSNQNLFMNLFIDGFVLNKCCYECPHTQLPRISDITLGDYWGVQFYNTNWPIRDGISSIVATTDKGKKTIESLAQKKLIELQPQNFRKLYNGQPYSYNIRIRKRAPLGRSNVLAALRTAPLEKVHDTYHNHIKVFGIKIHRNSILAKFAKIPGKLATLFRKQLS